MVSFSSPPTIKQDVKTEKRSTTKAYGGSVSFLFRMGVVGWIHLRSTEGEITAGAPVEPENSSATEISVWQNTPF